jgi:hypothetical protein
VKYDAYGNGLTGPLVVGISRLHCQKIFHGATQKSGGMGCKRCRAIKDGILGKTLDSNRSKRKFMAVLILSNRDDQSSVDTRRSLPEMGGDDVRRTERI